MTWAYLAKHVANPSFPAFRTCIGICTDFGQTSYVTGVLLHANTEHLMLYR